jgi:hypothetical protein
MKILSIKQPWASLIVTGGTNVQTGAIELKDVENRTWTTRYRGPVLVHASGRADAITPDEIERRFGVRLPSQLPLGGVIGVTEIVDCVRTHPSKWYAPGCCAFVLASSRALPFVRWKGALSLRSAPAELVELIDFLSCRAA